MSFLNRPTASTQIQPVQQATSWPEGHRPIDPNFKNQEWYNNGIGSSKLTDPKLHESRDLSSTYPTTYIHSIRMQQAYKDWSIAEIRLQDYLNLRTYGEDLIAQMDKPNEGTENIVFKPVLDESSAGSTSSSISSTTRETYHNINMMLETKGNSLPELRLFDYSKGLVFKGDGNTVGGSSGFNRTGGFGASTTSGFGNTTGGGGFNSSGSGFSATSQPGGFGSSTTGGFGNTTSGFGSKTTGGFGTNTTSGFGTTNNTGGFGNTATGGFGNTNTGGFGSGNTTGGFGTSNTSGFGTSNATTGGFGNTGTGGGFGSNTGSAFKPATGFSATPSSGFGANTNTASGFGNTSSAGGFGTNTATTGFGAGSGFGNKPATGFGSSATTGFGNTASTGFGATSTGGFGLNNASTGFGNTTSAFGQKQAGFGTLQANNSLTGNNQQAKPLTGFGAGFGANSNTAAGSLGFGSGLTTGNISTGGGFGFNAKPATGNLFNSTAPPAANTGLLGNQANSTFNFGSTPSLLFGQNNQSNQGLNQNQKLNATSSSNPSNPLELKLNSKTFNPWDHFNFTDQLLASSKELPNEPAKPTLPNNNQPPTNSLDLDSKQTTKLDTATDSDWVLLPAPSTTTAPPPTTATSAQAIDAVDRFTRSQDRPERSIFVPTPYWLQNFETTNNPSNTPQECQPSNQAFLLAPNLTYNIPIEMAAKLAEEEYNQQLGIKNSK